MKRRGCNMIGNMWGLLAFLSIPIILFIHLFRSRFQPQRVAGLFLWMTPNVDPSTGRRIHKLEPTRSLIAELILAILLSTLCCDIRLGEGAVVDHRVIILDSTASLSAVGNDTNTLHAARRRAHQLIDELPSSARVTLIASATHPVVLCGPAGLQVEAREAIDNWEPTERTHALESSWALALELSGTEATPHVISDRPVGSDPRFIWHSIGTPLANAGFLSTRRTRGRGDLDRVFVRIAAHTRGVFTTTLSVIVNGKTIQKKSLRFKKSGEQGEAFNVAAGDSPISLSLSNDALAIDNNSTLLRPAQRTLTIQVQMNDEESADAIRKALSSTRSVRLTTDEAPQVLFTDNPTAVGDSWTCFFSRATAATVKTEDWLGPFLMDKSHPVMEGTSFDGIVWGGVEPGRSQGLHPLLLAGETVLLGERVMGDRRQFVFNTVLGKGNLTVSPDWPVLIQNIVNERQQQLPGLRRINLRAGDDTVLHLHASPSTRIVHERPGGTTQSYPPRRDIRISEVTQVGRHTIRADDKTFAFSVNFQDGNVSNLLGARTISGSEAGVGKDRGERVESAIDQRINAPLILMAITAFLANLYFLRPKHRKEVGT